MVPCKINSEGLSSFCLTKNWPGVESRDVGEGCLLKTFIGKCFSHCCLRHWIKVEANNSLTRSLSFFLGKAGNEMSTGI